MKKNKAVKENVKGHFHLHKYMNWNIGTVIFLALFLYMFISMIIYLTADHISSYQVTAGPLSKNETCTAVVMREESVVPASASGYINYFTRDYSKVRQGGIVCGIGNSLQSFPSKGLDELDLNSLRKELSKFSRYYTRNQFSNVYDFKYSLQGQLLNDATEDVSSGGSTMLMPSGQDGIVVYSIDGMESLTKEDLTLETFNQKNYERSESKRDAQVRAGDPAYKLVTSEEWSVIFPVTDKQVIRLASHKKIKVKFLKDGESETGTLEIFSQEDQRYIKITFSSGMIRYAGERFLDVELVTNTESGLKIPTSSVVKKEFFTIPSSMRTKNDENTAGFRREIKDKDGKVTTEFINATVYATETPEGSKEEICYLDMDTLKEGDILVNPENNTRFTVGQKGSLEGVYCTNKGYAVFRKITTIDQNEEYRIVESGTRYGISQFDYIVLNGATVNEKEILY